MKNNQLYMNSVSGKKLFVQTWIPTSKSIATIILIHGFGEHSSRYESYISLFVEKNISVLSFDQIGHGQSEGKRGCIQSYNQLLDDVGKAIAKANEIFPNTPKILYGHSMGGNIALNYLLKKKNKLNGGIITSPWLKLYNEPNAITRKTVSILKHIIPNMTINSKLNDKYISTLPKEVEEYKKNKLNHVRISLRLFDSINLNGKWAITQTQKLNIPTLMLHGTADKITQCDATREAAKNNKTLITHLEYRDMYHELHNDAVRNKMAEVIFDWITTKIN